MVNTALVPGTIEAGPVFTTRTSALGLSGVNDWAVLLAGFASLSLPVTVVLFSIGSGEVYEAGTE